MVNASRSEYVLLGTNRLARIAESIIAAGSTDGTIQNLLFGPSTIFWERETAGTQSRIELDLGAGNAEVANFFYLRGVELFEALTAGAFTIELIGSNNNFSSETTLFTFSGTNTFSSKVGTYEEDVIDYNINSITAYRYFAIEINSANSVKHILRKAYFGKFIDFGRDPSYPYGANLKDDSRAFIADSGSTFKTSSGRRPLVLDYGWRGISDTVRNALITDVERYTNDYPVVLYQPSGSTHSPLCGFSTVFGWATVTQQTDFWKNLNQIALTLTEDIVG